MKNLSNAMKNIENTTRILVQKNMQHFYFAWKFEWLNENLSSILNLTNEKKKQSYEWI